MKYDKLKIIFLGTPEFSVPALKALVENDLRPVLVITQPDKPVGRSQKPVISPVKKFALKNGLAVAQPAKKSELKEIFGKQEIDVCVLVAYGIIIPKDILDRPKLGFLNLHPSLLPKYRGSSPIQSALLAGDSKTGITIIQLTDQVDAGPIVCQKEVEIKPDDNGETLHDRLAQAGADLLIKNLPDYLAGKIKAKPQDEALATYTKMIKREDGRINWQKKVLEIKRQFKAFYPWPGVFTHLDGKRLKIANLGALEGDFGVNLTPGEVFLGPKEELLVKCGQGAVSLNLVQLESKKEMSGQDFLRGHQGLIGKILK